MNKSDLKDGMTLVYRNGCKVDYYKEHLLDFESEGIGKMDSFNDDLTHKEHDFWDVCKIIEDDLIIWERKEVNWSKVSVGTKVLVSDTKTHWFKGIFLREIKRSKNDNYFKIVSSSGDIERWKYCKLAEKQKEEVTYKEMTNCVDDICNRHYKKNKTCYGCTAFDSNTYCNKSVLIDDNFTITRK